MKELLKALAIRKDSQLIFTMPNADPNNSIIFELIENFVNEHANACLHTSLGQTLYFSCLAQIDAVIGNSSSGLLEAPSFKKATINIGDRQNGRLCADSVINCKPEFNSINTAINNVFTDSFQNLLSTTINPSGSGGSVDSIMQTLKYLSFSNLLKKNFYDWH